MLHTFKAFPKASERQAWEALAADESKRNLTAAALSSAEEQFDAPIPALSAEHYMDFVLNGDRARYENCYFARRRNLEIFVLAECLEHKGRFIGKVIEYVWAMLGEPTWCVPAHAGQLNKEPDPLPPSEWEVVDLFNSDSAMYLAQTLELLGDELSAVSKNLTRRMRNEIIRRVIVPIEQYIDRFFWTEGVSNWTPWICSNLLWTANIVLADDATRFNSYVELLVPCIKKYYDKYPEDGACDEGIGYWNVSPAKFFMFSYGIYLASDGAISCFHDSKFRKMIAYLTDSWCWGYEFVRFADNGGKQVFHTGLIRKMAEMAGVQDGIAMVNHLEDLRADYPKNYTGLISTLFKLFGERKSEAKLSDKNFGLYPRTEQLFTRANGHFIAIKGGNNNEGHNHNDVGQFVVGANGRFMALDLGSARYNKFTFSEKRYENYPQSGFSHNALVFNGVAQVVGEERRTSLFEAEGDADKFTCRMELSKCYPESLGLLYYYRTLSLEDGVFTVHDEWSASAPLTPSMTILHQEATPGFVADAQTETVQYPLDDVNLVGAWGKMLYKTLLTAPEGTAGSVTLKFKL